MYGNLSQTIVKLPKFFHISSYLSSCESSKTRYREPPLLDTFSQIKKINSYLKRRYFRLNDHFKENAPYKDLNFNNNKRYISPLTKIKPRKIFNNYFIAENSNRFRKSNSQTQIMPKNPNTLISNNNSSKDMINTNNINILENNRYSLLSNTINIEDKNNLSSINESQMNNNKNNDEINESNANLDNNEDIRFKLYKKKLIEKKPKNLKELKEYLDFNYMDNKKFSLPKIRSIHKSISQDDLFKKSLDKKIESLTLIKPEVKNLLYRRNNIILKKDYDLLHKLYSKNKNNPLPIKKSNNACQECN
jgi:hypothetical protein